MANLSGEQQFDLAKHYYAMGRYETAEGIFAELLASEPQNSCYLYNYALCLTLQDKQEKQVVEIFKSLLADDNYGCSANLELAELYIENIDLDYRNDILEAIKSGTSTDQFMALKNARRELDRTVLPLINEAIRLQPNSSSVLAMYSRYYTAGRHYKKAKMYLAKAKKIDHQNPRVILAEHSLISQNGLSLNEASNLSDILNSKMSEAGKLFMISQSYRSAKKYKKAFEYAKQAYLISPTDKTVVIQLMQLEYLCKPINLFFLSIYKRKIYLSSFAVLIASMVAYRLTKRYPFAVVMALTAIYLFGYRLYFSHLYKMLNKIEENHSK